MCKMMCKTVSVLLGCFILFRFGQTSTTDDGFLSSCKKYFYKGIVPKGFPPSLKYICQRYDGSFYFATLYDTANRIPIYSAYTIEELQCTGKQPSRRDNWFIEPELAGRSKQADMDTDKTSEHGWTTPVQAVNEDYKDTDFDRGHLNPNFMHCGSARTATFSLTNSVPQDSCMNRIVWYEQEVELKKKFDSECAYDNARRYVVTGAVPSKNEFIPQKDLVVEDMLDRVPERVNVPSHMWTMACCDVSDVKNSTVKPFFVGHVGENKAGGMFKTYDNVSDITKKLEELYGYEVKVFADGCGVSGDQQDDSVFG